MATKRTTHHQLSVSSIKYFWTKKEKKAHHLFGVDRNLRTHMMWRARTFSLTETRLNPPLDWGCIKTFSYWARYLPDQKKEVRLDLIARQTQPGMVRTVAQYQRPNRARPFSTRALPERERDLCFHECKILEKEYPSLRETSLCAQLLSQDRWYCQRTTGCEPKSHYVLSRFRTTAPYICPY